MWPIVTDQVVWAVCLSVTLVSPVKTAEPIEMPFGLKTQVDPGNHVLDGGSRSPMCMGNFEGKSHLKLSFFCFLI